MGKRLHSSWKTLEISPCVTVFDHQTDVRKGSVFRAGSTISLQYNSFCWAAILIAVSWRRVVPLLMETHDSHGAHKHSAILVLITAPSEVLLLCMAACLLLQWVQTITVQNRINSIFIYCNVLLDCLPIPEEVDSNHSLLSAHKKNCISLCQMLKASPQPIIRLSVCLATGLIGTLKKKNPFHWKRKKEREIDHDERAFLLVCLQVCVR